MCSSIFGPAIVPSFVICPIKMTGIFVLFAKLMSSDATDLICVILPAALSTSES